MSGDDTTVVVDAPVPFGIDAESGCPLPALQTGDLAALASIATVRPYETVLERRADPGMEGHFGVLGELDPMALDETGWGVIIASDIPGNVKDGLEPLLARRRDQAGHLFKLFEGPDAPRPGESVAKWLGRHGASMQVVDPALGVPFYLLIVGSPESIPFEFQYGLDIFFGVGRLHFDTATEYRRYADSVVMYETAAKPATSRQAALFATTHDFDRATQLFTSRVAKPLVQGASPLGSRQKFGLQSFVGDPATKQQFSDILAGDIPGGPPSVLFSGTHGMAFPKDDARLRDTQGALVSQDWSGFGKIEEDDWFAASDVPAAARIHGLIHVLFACYGAGCPSVDNFQRASGAPKVIAPAAMISRLPQALLTHRDGGALAVIGHVERAWAYSFVSEKGGAQTQGFRDVIGRLLRGDRAGQAMDSFNMRWAALSTELSESLDSLAHGGEMPDAILANRWVARDDARNYILFGDPAVRLRVEDMPAI